MASIFRRPLSAMGQIVVRRSQPTPTLGGLATNSTRAAAASPVVVVVHRRFASTTTTTTTTGRLDDGGVVHDARETIKITYIDPGGGEHAVDAEIGKNLMDVAHDNNIELEGKRFF
jgi:hypothetical protein